MTSDIKTNKQTEITNVYRYILAWELRKVIVSPTVYPPLVVNYNCCYFSVKSGPTQLRISSIEHSRGFLEFPNPNLRQIGPGVPEL